MRGYSVVEVKLLLFHLLVIIDDRTTHFLITPTSVHPLTLSSRPQCLSTTMWKIAFTSVAILISQYSFVDAGQLISKYETLGSNVQGMSYILFIYATLIRCLCLIYIYIHMSLGIDDYGNWCGGGHGGIQDCCDGHGCPSCDINKGLNSACLAECPAVVRIIYYLLLCLFVF